MTSAPVNSQLVASRYDYLPFGEEVAAGVGMRTTAQGYSQSDSVRKRSAGMEGDDATGMSHTLWREYDDMRARWTAPDPYSGSMEPSSPQSFNRYNYVNNDPVNKVDPTGLMAASEGWGSVQNAWGGDPGFNDPHFGGPGIVAGRMAQYDQDTETFRDGKLAQSYLDNGNYDAAIAIFNANPNVGLRTGESTAKWGGEAASYVKEQTGGQVPLQVRGRARLVLLGIFSTFS